MDNKQNIEKLDMSTPNITDDNVARIAELFPNVVTEGRDENGKLTHVVDFDALKQELSDSIVEGPHERYRLDWPGKREAMLAANTPITKTLRPVPEESVDFDTTKNLFIEGDNLDALKLLQETYLGKVKMIYIDPPYNTGKDFIYKDNFTGDKQEYLQDSGQLDEEGGKLVANPESNGRYHSDWLSMMYPRLKLARNILRDDGVIFISIDDNEQGNLREVCDQIFGADNFVNNIIWQKKYAASNDAKYLSDVHDFILIYAKNKEIWRPNMFPRPKELNDKYKNPDNDPRGPWYSTNLSVKTYSSKNDYIITSPAGIDHRPPASRCWVVSKDKYEELLNDNRIWFGKDGTSRPYQKKFLTEVQQGVVPTTLWMHKDAGHTIGAKSEIRDLFKDTTGLFDTPKPVKLLSRLIDLVASSETNDIFMDFFAGSSTIAHAIYFNNSEKNKNNKFIAVQIAEDLSEKSDAYRSGYSSIAEISKERIRRAGKKILEENPDQVGKHDVGFRVLKIDSSNMNDVYYAPGELDQGSLLDAVEHIKPDRTSEDLLFQVMLDWGVDLSLPIVREQIDGKTVFWVGDDDLAACFDLKITEDVVKVMAEHKPLRAVFRDDGFGSDDMKINAGQLFAQMTDGHTDMKVI